MTLKLNIAGTIDGTISKTFADRSIIDRPQRSGAIELADGTGADQGDVYWESYGRILTATSEQIDLSGTLENQYGDAAVFARIKCVLVVNRSTVDGEVLTLGGGANEAPWFKSATHQFDVDPSGFFVFGSPLATGKVVTAATADQLTIDAGAATITYDIVVVGTSA